MSTNNVKAPRAWLVKEKKMVEVDGIRYDHRQILYCHAKSEHGKAGNWFGFDNCTILHPTGLTDCKGVEGYEADLCLPKDEDGRIYEIMWDDKDACFWLVGRIKQDLPTSKVDIRLPMRWLSSVTIVGNTKEHPDLLPQPDGGEES